MDAGVQGSASSVEEDTGGRERGGQDGCHCGGIDIGDGMN